MALPKILDLNWRRLMRWSILGAVVMMLWLLAPTVKCSWKAWRDEPLDEAYPLSDTPGAHKQDVIEGDGFFSRWGSAIKLCYKRKPPFDQEKWKRNLFVGFAAAAMLFFIISEIEKRTKKTYS
jgi:hypothetical protein